MILGSDKMIFRNRMSFLVAAMFAAATFSIGGTSTLEAQQFPSVGCTSCGSSVSFPSVSSPVVGSASSIGTFTNGTFANGTFANASPVRQVNYVPAQTFTSAAPAIASPVYAQAQAQAVYSQPVYSQQYSQQYSQPVSTSRVQPVATGRTGLAQSKARRAAQGLLRGHVGGGLGNANYEGVGWSSQSAQAAIEQCCYWGQRQPAEIGVSRGADGLWYACVLYN